MSKFDYVDFLAEERYCIQNEDLIYNKILKTYKKNKADNKVDEAIKLFNFGLTRLEVSKKLRLNIKTVERYFDKWVFTKI